MKAVRALIVVMITMAGACSDSPMAPSQSIDRVAAARIVPAVTDARTRLAMGIENLAVRERMVHDLGELETALVNGDGQKARFHVKVLETVLLDYRAQQGAARTDGAEATAVALALHAASQVVHAGFEIRLFTS